MWSNGLICGREARFSLLPKPTKPSLYCPHPAARLFFRTRLPKQQHHHPLVSGVGSGGVRASAAAAVGDCGGAVAEAAVSFYELLGIPPSGSYPEIKQAYKQLVRRYHPDVSPPGRVEEYTRRFIRVQEAYETLSDPTRRAVYDRDMASGLQFSGRRRYADGGMRERSEWKNRWQTQLSELKRRSRYKDAGEGNTSWGARMRRQRYQSSAEP